MSILRLRSDQLDWREVDGEIVALETRNSVYLSTNASGMALWCALAGGTTREALVTELADRYEIERERAGSDVDVFLAELDRHGLLDR